MRHRGWLLPWLVWGLLALGGGSGLWAQVAGVTWHDGRLSLDVTDAELPALIETIAAQTGIEVRHLEGLPRRRLTLRLPGVPLVEGLKRLLRAAEVTGYALITEQRGGREQVVRLLFLPVVASPPPRPAPLTSAPPSAPPAAAAGGAAPEGGEGGGSVVDELRRNATARRLLSQLVHPNEQVRERALEQLIRLVNDEARQAELLEILEPLLEDMAAEDRETREAARREIRQLLQP